MADKSPAGAVSETTSVEAAAVDKDTTSERLTRSQASSESPRSGMPTPTALSTPRATVAGRVWVAIGGAVVVLVLLIIFIAENSNDVTVSFLGANGTLSLGLALLIAAVAGVVITLLAGSTRILQLRREVRRHKRRGLARH